MLISKCSTDFSNDDLDDNDDEEDEPSSSLALSYKSVAAKQDSQNITKTLLNQQPYKFKKARSVTPETNIEEYEFLSVGRSNAKKQRPLTVERRSVTPEILQKSSKLTNSQTSLISRQSSGSKNSSLERQIKQYEEEKFSRRSSSSSERDDIDNVRRTNPNRLPIRTNFGEYRIRRSRYFIKLSAYFNYPGVCVFLDLYSFPNALRPGLNCKNLFFKLETRHLNKQ